MNEINTNKNISINGTSVALYVDLPINYVTRFTVPL